jgi:glutathione synthase/RimK-type ligase-like ATP-grasp enzyme
MRSFAIVYLHDFTENVPFLGFGDKRAVYKELLMRLGKKDLETYVVSTKNYLGTGIFRGGWKFTNSNFSRIADNIKIDLAYDRAGGLSFPWENDCLRVVDNREFKLLSWDKWQAYKLLGKYMPETLWAGGRKNVPGIIEKITGDYVVVKPANGLKGRDIYIGKKSDFRENLLQSDKPVYIVQKYIETKDGVPGVAAGRHDIRVVIINSKIVWSHVRTPPKGMYQANVAQGGTLREIDLKKIPAKIMEIAGKVAKTLTVRYDNPIYSLDFGVDKKGKPYLFELNDQIGFPKKDMENKDYFLEEMVKNFVSKI